MQTTKRKMSMIILISDKGGIKTKIIAVDRDSNWTFHNDKRRIYQENNNSKCLYAH